MIDPAVDSELSFVQPSADASSCGCQPGFKPACRCKPIVFRSVWDRLIQQLFGVTPPDIDSEDQLPDIAIWKDGVELLDDSYPYTFRVTVPSGHEGPKPYDVIFYEGRYYVIGEVSGNVCSECIPIDASILEVYIQLLGEINRAHSAADRAIDAAEHQPIIIDGFWAFWNPTAERYIVSSQPAQGETGAAAGFGTVDATIDTSVGTPIVEVTATGPDTAKNFSFAFHNMKGEPGAKGLAAGFGTPSASVDANTGTPSVEISASGPDTAKIFSFAFHNLKGAKGDPGDVTGAVRFDLAQSLTNAQKQQARTNIGAGDYTKPEGGIPKRHLASGVQASLDAADTAYQKPQNGIPAGDLASGVIPDVSNFITKTVDDLTNYYLKSETYTKGEVEGLIAAISQFHYEIYASTSAVTIPANNVLYLIGPTGSGADKYEEYVYANNTWTKIGDTSVDLSGYVTTSALNTALADYTTTANLTTLLAGKQDTISDLDTIRSGAANNVKYTQQSLTDAQKLQARTNIGAGADKTLVSSLSSWPSALYTDKTTAEAAQIWGITTAQLEDLHEGRYDRIVNANNMVLQLVYVEAPNLFGVKGICLFDKNKLYTLISTSDGNSTTYLGGFTNIDLSHMESTENRRSTWQTTPDDTHYPSEKLVKDSLDGKQATIDANHKLDYSLIDNTPVIDSTPTANSTNLVTSGGVKTYVDNHSVTVDSMTNAEIDTAVNSAWV